MPEQTVVLEPINFEDLKSPDPQVRRRATRIVADNERRLYGRVTRATAEALRCLDVEQAQEPNADSAGNSPVGN